MSETYEVYAEMLETLRQAQGAVRQQFEILSQGPEPDGATLMYLSQAVASFDDQAYSLILMMSEREVPGELIRMAEELGHFFEDARRQVGNPTEAGRGRG